MRRGVIGVAATALIAVLVGLGWGARQTLAALPYGPLFSAKPFPPTTRQFVRNVACFISNTHFGITGRPFFPVRCPPSPS
ncbi:MAG: hypothetical protein RMK73_15235 [Geminicoccaceae bacterium]|nr:hypothetical protein [Geminicoccaceae bacterium]